MTRTHNNPVYIRDVRIAKLRELKTRMQKLSMSKDEIMEKLLTHCLFRYNLTTRTANDYVKVAMLNPDENLEQLLKFKEELIEPITA